MTATDMTSATSILVVTARAEQMPSTCNAIGLLLNSGSSSGLACGGHQFAPSPRSRGRDTGPKPSSPSQNCTM